MNWFSGVLISKDKIEEIAARQARLGVPGRSKVEDEAGVYWILVY